MIIVFYFNYAISVNQLLTFYYLDISCTGVAGFEPANGGVKVHSLTTWRYPKSIDMKYEFNGFIKDDVILVLLRNFKYWARRDSNP